jgi:hypothetical protein
MLTMNLKIELLQIIRTLNNPQDKTVILILADILKKVFKKMRDCTKANTLRRLKLKERVLEMMNRSTILTKDNTLPLQLIRICLNTSI